MIVVFSMAAVLWGVGLAMKAPVQARLTMIGLLLVGVLAIQIALPDGHPLREGTGAEPEFWVLVIAFAALATLYGRGLKWLRARQQQPDISNTPVADRSVELERNARHIVLREIGGAGQKRLKSSSVLVVGAGGLGSPVLQYLGASGIGTIGVIDDDIVENSNLARQVIHNDADIGMPKVFSAEAAIRAQNPFVTVKPFNRRLTAEIADALLADFDLVIDGSDNATTRYEVNAAAHKARIPLISGAISQWEGQVTVFDTARGSACYQCVFPEPAAAGLAPSCAEAGVVGPLPGVIGTMMAVEAIKILSGAGSPLLGQMLIYDAQDAEVRKIALSPKPDCPICKVGARQRNSQRSISKGASHESPA